MRGKASLLCQCHSNWQSFGFSGEKKHVFFSFPFLFLRCKSGETFQGGWYWYVSTCPMFWTDRQLSHKIRVTSCLCSLLSYKWLSANPYIVIILIVIEEQPSMRLKLATFTLPYLSDRPSNSTNISTLMSFLIPSRVPVYTIYLSISMYLLQRLSECKIKWKKF